MEARDIEQRAEHAYPLAGQVSRALEGAVFPLRRRELVLVALNNEAPRLLLSLLERLPDRSYLSLEAVERAADSGR